MLGILLMCNLLAYGIKYIAKHCRRWNNKSSKKLKNLYLVLF